MDLECSIRDVCPTKYAQMMNLVDLDLFYSKAKFDF